MEIITIIGVSAGILTTASFLPQVYKAWKYKKTNDLSLVMYIILLIGSILWIIYGVMLKDLPIIIANIVITLLVIALLAMIVVYGKRKQI